MSSGAPGGLGTVPDNMNPSAPPRPVDFLFTPGMTMRLSIRTKDLTPDAIARQQHPDRYTHVNCYIVNRHSLAAVPGLEANRVPAPGNGQAVEFIWRVPMPLDAPSGVAVQFAYINQNGETGGGGIPYGIIGMPSTPRASPPAADQPPRPHRS